MRHLGILVFAAVFLAAFSLPLPGQQGGGSSGSSGGSAVGTSSTRGRGATTEPGGPGRISGRMPGYDLEKRTIIISGRVQSVSANFGEQIRVEFWNHGRLLQAVFSDLRGNFTFTFDGNQGPHTPSGNSAAISDASYSAQRNRFLGVGSTGNTQALVRGGEVRVNVAGFHSVSKMILGPLSMLTDVGTITLARLAKVDGTAVSLTSLQAPKKARKEMNNAAKLIKKSKAEEAAKHLQKAVEIYPQYAVAWNLLGDIYLRQNQPEKARQAFSESVKADPKYIRPYLGQADIQMRSRQFTELLETTSTLLRLDPTHGTASYYKAVGHYSLGQFGEAEKHVQAAIQSPSGAPSFAHYLLGSLLARKGTYPEAAKELRLFLKIAPGTPAAVEAQKLLTQTESQLSRLQQAEIPAQ